MQQLKTSEFSGISFLPVNATASGVRSDKSDTASFPQHLTLPLKLQKLQKVGACCRGAPRAQGKGRKPQIQHRGLCSPQLTKLQAVVCSKKGPGRLFFLKWESES